MKSVLLAIAVALHFVTVAQTTDFCSGWSSGYSQGWCYGQYHGCLPIIPPLCPLPLIGEQTFQHGYNRGFTEGQQAWKNIQQKNSQPPSGVNATDPTGRIMHMPANPPPALQYNSNQYRGLIQINKEKSEFKRALRKQESANYKSNFQPNWARKNCLSGNCYNGIGTKEISDVGIYTGNFRSGVFDGQGTLEYTAPGTGGAKYIGMFRNGKPHGYGELTKQDRSLYRGYFRKGKKEGNGTLILIDGQIIKGVWINNRRIE